MKKLNIDWKKTGNTIKNSVGFIVGVAAFVLPYTRSMKAIANTVRYERGDVKYSDAVGAVSNSDMFSSAKDEVITLLPKDGDAELYKAVIQIVNSDMFSNSKVNSIKRICNIEEEA